MGKRAVEDSAGTERRAQARYPVQLRVELRSPENELASPHQGQTQDISSSGFYLLGAPESLHEGSRVQVSLWLPEGLAEEQAGLRGLGRVVRLERRENEALGVAVKFERVELASKTKAEESES